MVNLFFLVIFALVGLLGYYLFRKEKMHRQQHEDLYDVFDHHPIKPPTLEIQRIHLWPAFTVTFFDKSDYDYANNSGLFERFNSRIQRFYDKDFPSEHQVTYKWIA